MQPTLTLRPSRFSLLDGNARKLWAPFLSMTLGSWFSASAFWFRIASRSCFSLRVLERGLLYMLATGVGGSATQNDAKVSKAAVCFIESQYEDKVRVILAKKKKEAACSKQVACGASESSCRDGYSVVSVKSERCSLQKATVGVLQAEHEQPNGAILVQIPVSRASPQPQLAIW